MANYKLIFIQFDFKNIYNLKAIIDHLTTSIFSQSKRETLGSIKGES